MHLYSKRIILCQQVYRSQKLTTEQFIERAKKVHGDKYDYSKVDYINAKTEVCIICPIHGEFWQKPDKHLCGHNCPKCHPYSKKSTNKFIELARKIHGNKYDYSKTVYKGMLTKICVTCPTHGDFLVLPNNHLHGDICRKCYEENRRKNINRFIEEARKIHGDKYDYSKVDYVNALTKVCIICPEHGEFWQTPANHLSSKGCRKCHGRYYMNTDEFINEAKKVHGDKYDYSKVEYNGMFNNVCIICPIHGEFWQKPIKHLNKQGCPICKESHLENEIRNLLIRNGIKFEQEKKFDWLVSDGNLRLDFYIPDKKIAIECQGIQHFIPIEYFGGIDMFEKQKKMDELKKQLCEKHNIKVLYYTNILEYKTLTKKELIGMIKSQ